MDHRDEDSPRNIATLAALAVATLGLYGATLLQFVMLGGG